jgi:hypothetical protein
VIRASNTATDPLAPPYRGGYGGFRVRAEMGSTAFGIGIATLPRGYSADYHDPTGQPGDLVPVRGTRYLPSFSLRLGDPRRLLVRLESGSPSSPGGTPELLHLGIGGEFSSRRHSGWQADAGLTEFPDLEGPGGAFHLQFVFPAGRTTGVGVVGGLHTTSQSAAPSLGLFLTVDPRH